MAGLKLALRTFWSPLASLGEAAAQRRFGWALALATFAALCFGLAAARSVDYAGPAEARLMADREESAKLTPHERVEKLEAARKVGQVGAVAGGLVGPSLNALGLALVLWLGFKVGGGRPAFGATLAVAASALLPLALKDLLTVPALLRHEGIAAAELDVLLPSNVLAWMPRAAELGPRAAALGALDLFSIWSLVLVAIGMAGVAVVSKKRSAAIAGVLWISYVAVFRFALPAMAAKGAA